MFNEIDRYLKYLAKFKDIHLFIPKAWLDIYNIYFVLINLRAQKLIMIFSCDTLYICIHTLSINVCRYIELTSTQQIHFKLKL